MAAALQSQLEQVGTYEQLPFIERLALLIDQECLSRDQRKQQRLIRQARFKLNATVQEIDYQHPRNISPAQIARLAQGQWIERAQNLLITGPPAAVARLISPAPWATTPVGRVTACVTIASRGCSSN
jgi:DNA replication protein DnaC